MIASIFGGFELSHIRGHLDTDSGFCWTPVPELSGHSFRYQLDTDSGNIWTYIPELSGHSFRKHLDTLYKFYRHYLKLILQWWSNQLHIIERRQIYGKAIVTILDNIYNPNAFELENARANNVELHVIDEMINKKVFKELWKKINIKSVYTVNFEPQELIKNSVEALNKELRVSKIFFKIEEGAMEDIKSKEDLMYENSFVREKSDNKVVNAHANSNVKYDLVGKIVTETGLCRKDIVSILKLINKPVFDQFADNPEEFIIKAANIINEQKATAIVQHITYNKLEETYGTDVFTEPTLKGKLGINAMKATRHLYDHILYDSKNEKEFAEKLDKNINVAIYIKLPNGFFINTTVGHYNPDWAIAFTEGTVKHIYFVAETKGNVSSMELRKVESAKMDCAREHFKAISSETVK